MGDEGNGVRITNRELYDRIERFEADMRARLENQRNEESAWRERNAEQMFRLKLGLGLAVLGVMGTLAKLFADLGLPGVMP